MNFFISFNICFRMSSEIIIKEIEEIAREAHGSQRRKFVDEPYTAHLHRVRDLLKAYDSSLVVQASALLHDVLEDTSVTREELALQLIRFVNADDVQQILQLVDELTDRYVKADYPQWNRRKRKEMEAQRLAEASGTAQTIKYADILDNSTDIVNAESDFAKQYLYESRLLLHKMENGNAALRERAMTTVQQLLDRYDND